MNPIVLQFANGNVFFIGLAMVVATAAIYLRRNGRFIRSLLTISSLIGILLVISSATPLPPWLYGLWLGFCLAILVFGNITTPPGSLPRCRLVLFATTALASLILALIELPYHFSPYISVSPNRPVYVVGDSISAGIAAKERPWPLVLGDLARVKVTNLARPGATAETALAQAAQITGHGCLIIVEIGGNDLISGTDSQVFYNQLYQLIGRLCAHENQVIMLEIPLFPGRNGFGKAQRDLAKKHGASLLPKKFLTHVFGLPDATVDGLHLSQVGHDALAQEIYGTLSFK